MQTNGGHGPSIRQAFEVYVDVVIDGVCQLLTDRFAVVGDAGAICDTAKGMRCGGSWQGIINHVDYIQQLGFDAVWISPIVANLEGVTKYGQAYHG